MQSTESTAHCQKMEKSENMTYVTTIMDMIINESDLKH